QSLAHLILVMPTAFDTSRTALRLAQHYRCRGRRHGEDGPHRPTIAVRLGHRFELGAGHLLLYGCCREVRVTRGEHDDECGECDRHHRYCDRSEEPIDVSCSHGGLLTGAVGHVPHEEERTRSRPYRPRPCAFHMRTAYSDRLSCTADNAANLFRTLPHFLGHARGAFRHQYADGLDVADGGERMRDGHRSPGAG